MGVVRAASAYSRGEAGIVRTASRVVSESLSVILEGRQPLADGMMSRAADTLIM